MLKLWLQCFGHLMWRADSLEKTLMMGKIEGKRGSEWQKMRWLNVSLTQCTWVWASSRRCEGQGSLACWGPWGCRELNMTDQLNKSKFLLQCSILHTYLASNKIKPESSRKTSISALLTMPKPLTVWITTNWKILKEIGIPDHLTCLLRNLYAGLEATVRTGHETTDWFQIGKGVCQGCILSPCLFNF